LNIFHDIISSALNVLMYNTRLFFGISTAGHIIWGISTAGHMIFSGISIDLLRNFNSWSHDLRNFNSWSHDILNKKMCIVHNWIQNELKSQKMVLSATYFPCQSNIYVMHVVWCRTVNNKQAGITILYKMVRNCA
jgi:hypothetical protein